MKIKQKSTSKKKIIAALAIILLLLVATSSALYYYKIAQPQKNKENYGSETTSPVASQPKSSTTQDNSLPNMNTPKDNTGHKDDTTTDQPSNNTALTPSKPVGVFVSNHHPNLSGAPAPNTMNSTCSTSVGVHCTIEFKKGSIIRSLNAKKTDNNGNVTWNWKLQDIDLSPGTWQVTAIATNGDKSVSASDPMNLEVSP